MVKRLYRSKVNKVIAGVCGGVAEYFNMDPLIIRIAWIALSLAAFGTGIIVYIIAAIIIPEGSQQQPSEPDYGPAANDDPGAFKPDDFKFDADEWKKPAHFDSRKSGVLIGAILVLLGLMFMVRQYFHWFNMSLFWPVIVIAVGAFIIFKGRNAG